MLFKIGQRNGLSASSLLQGAGVVDSIVGKDTPGRLHSFQFLSGTREEVVNNNNIEEKKLLIPLTVTMVDASPEAQ